MVDAAKAASAVAPKDGDEKEGGAASAPAADANHALVRNLIGLHAQYNEIVNTSFEKTQVMQKALKKAFEDFINKDNRVSKLLAKFVHDALKKVRRGRNKTGARMGTGATSVVPSPAHPSCFFLFSFRFCTFSLRR